MRSRLGRCCSEFLQACNQGLGAQLRRLRSKLSNYQGIFRIEHRAVHLSSVIAFRFCRGRKQRPREKNTTCFYSATYLTLKMEQGSVSGDSEPKKRRWVNCDGGGQC